ncbi:inositol monophosphatase family protein [Erythrobacter sp. HL-111]|uniref:inositol monophosphatase family protein n=1 Tax=Erythrobacter sp. HL-111 TaxID=1798193 RepID=UPI0006DA290E|nr:inositol monophosphatase family protein [Erythrobacter sp. HL-111]KPP90280.1 MAG: Archaeal fructose-1,6-bisphosphatase and related enzymes of inositol monophosphatase family [Erythrobacteraceae bacterium HL-111]SDR85113.1 fructose-1,6-bisphosphatase [Erythrobacter sp. HL-111]
MSDLTALDAEIRDLLRFAATRSMMPRFRALTEAQVEMKGEDDPVTIVDREVEEFLTEALSRLAPGVAVVGEEAVHADASVLDRLSEQCWIIDPLDGTANFAAGKEPFGIIVALADAGRAIAGWIYDPVSDRLCHARAGEGARIDGEIVAARTTGEQHPVTAVSRMFRTAEEVARIEAELAPHYTLVDIPRCAAEQYPRLALGVNDLSTFKRTYPWDHAAGALWLNEAGGRAMRVDGSEYRVDDGDGKPTLVGASSPAIWDAFVALTEV